MHTETQPFSSCLALLPSRSCTPREQKNIFKNSLRIQFPISLATLHIQPSGLYEA